MKVLTANRLDDGEVIFWAKSVWVESFADAEIFREDEAARQAEGAARDRAAEAVDPYLIEVQALDGGCAPVSYRERIRALGPTNKREHGKQATGGVDVDLLKRAHGTARSSGRVNLIKRK